jgi:hypothetical protein
MSAGPHANGSANSIVDASGLPPTPTQTPTSLIFSGSLFQTPQNNPSSFDDLSGATPRFAQDISAVFNSTPARFQGSHAPFVDFSIPNTPYPPSSAPKRPLSAENIAAKIATHVNHFSSSPNLPLPPVDPSRRLSSSPGPLVTSHNQNLNPEDEGNQSGDCQDRSAKRRRASSEESRTQTATPPPSARKGARKLVPKLHVTTMQNEQEYAQEFVVGTPQNGMPNFVTTPTAMFYPMSAPATAPVFTDSRPFWDSEATLNGMDMDFANAAATMFHDQTRVIGGIDWSRANELFQEAPIITPQNQENHPPVRKERPLAPKPAVPEPEASNPDTSMFGTSFVTPVEDPFAMMGHGGGVDPGLLLTRPPSSHMEPAIFNPMLQPPLVASMSQPEPSQPPAKQSQRAELRRASSTKEISSKKLEKAIVTSPIKALGRPGLSRSFSENRGRKPIHRASLPALAPASRPTSQQGVTPRPISQSSRANGRTSPLKNHHRLSSLSSIAESITPKARASVKFTIDSRGRARAETMVVDNESGVRSGKEGGNPWSSSEEDESSEDDDPIIIPSRNASFVLPDPNKPTLPHPFAESRRSVSEQSGSSLGIYNNEPTVTLNDPESEAETVLKEGSGSSRGDAASELRKVVQDRHKRSLNTSQRFVAAPQGSGSTTSPTSLTENSVPTPTSSQANSIRCVCQRAESPRNSDGFMVQW